MGRAWIVVVVGSHGGLGRCDSMCQWLALLTAERRLQRQRRSETELVFACACCGNLVGSRRLPEPPPGQLVASRAGFPALGYRVVDDDKNRDRFWSLAMADTRSRRRSDRDVFFGAVRERARVLVVRSGVLSNRRQGAESRRGSEERVDKGRPVAARVGRNGNQSLRNDSLDS